MTKSKKIIQLLVLQAVYLSFASCATILNSPTTKITVHTFEKSEITINDTVTKTAKNKDSLVVSQSMGRINSFYQRNNINHLALNLSLPYVNFFQFRPQNLPQKSLFGFFGISIGGELGYSNNKSIVLTFGGVVNYPIPVPVGISWDPYGVREQMFTHYLSLEHQVRVFRHLIVGTGLSYNSMGWRHTDYGTGWDWQDTVRPKPIFMSERHRTLGLSLSAYVLLGEGFRLGVNYRPSFYRIRPRPAWEYSHVISVDLLLNLRLGF